MKTAKQLAREAGQVRYSTGKPCLRGHMSERLVSNGACIECAYARFSRYARSNRDKMTAKNKRWVAANVEKVRAIKAAWNKANPEGQAKRSRAWFLSNKDKANASTMAWQARNKARVEATRSEWRRQNKGKLRAAWARWHACLLDRTPPWADMDLIDDIYTLSSIYRDAGIDSQVDHIVPLRGELVSGLHVPQNLQLLYGLDNRSKSNRFQVS